MPLDPSSPDPSSADPRSPSTADTRLLAGLAPALRAGFLRAGYTVEGLEDALGPSGVAALGRSDATSTRRRARDAGDAGALLGLLVLGDALPRARVAELLPALDLDLAVRAGLFREAADGALAADVDVRPVDTGTGPAWVVADVDVRPVDTGTGPAWVVADTDGSMVPGPTRPDHVLGVGQASLSLLGIAPPPSSGRVLDLGTGCGIQLVPHGRASGLVGTDITPRCLDLAAATLALDGIDADLRRGSWFEPVAGERFARIVANPPFVVGTPEVGHTYRESGLHLDGATELVVREAPGHLEPGGIATLLGAWVLRPDEDWRSRISSWLPAEGVAAWVLLRDVSDPEQYVWTWLTDEGAAPDSPEYEDAANRWLDHFAAEGVAGIGFGYLYLQAIDGPTELECEDLSHPFDSGLGAEALAHFARSAWLRGASSADIDRTVFEIAPSVVMYESTRLACAGGRGAERGGSQANPDPGEGERWVVVERTSGPRWRHEVDATVARVLRGIEQGALPLADIAELAALAAGRHRDGDGDGDRERDRDDDNALLPELRGIVVDLVRHGVVLPAGVPGLALEEYLPGADS